MKFIFILIVLFITTKSSAFVVYEGVKIWNQDSITFYFMNGTDQEQAEVKKFAKLWQRYTGMQFKYTTIKPNRFGFKKYYSISFKGGKNESNQGAINGTIHLGNLSDDVIFRKATILHEFGHMLGLGHEHQRLDRPTILNNNALINACIQNQEQSKEWCDENFNDVSRTEVFVQSDYDFNSIMHYKLANVTGKDSDLLDDLPDSDNNTLSYTDKYYIAMLYNQTISDKTLKNMHKQDLWNQKKFELAAQIENENAILNLSTSSCKALKQNDQSEDGKYCDGGYMVIGIDDYSFPDDSFKECHKSFAAIKNIMDENKLCHLSPFQLRNNRKAWSQQFSKHGQCKRLDTNVKNKQEYFCTQGYSFVTKDNQMIGNKTNCYHSQESVFTAMQENEVCNMNDLDYRIYQRLQKAELQKDLKSKNCQVVNKTYDRVNCPKDFDYTIIQKGNSERPINDKCFASQYQAINAMKKIKICQY